MTTVPLERVPAGGNRWRTLGLLALIAILAVVFLGLAVGSMPKTVLPYGLAANGLVAYGRDGDIFTVDPHTGVRRAIVTGPEDDGDPRWSLDGTRVAFLRHVEDGDQLVIVDGDGGDPKVVSTETMEVIDPDGIKWAPDGRTIAVVSGPDIVLVDTVDGRTTTLPVDHRELEVFWRPPDGRELLFLGGWWPGITLTTISLTDGSIRKVPLPPGIREGLRPMGWTPDGTRIVATYATSVDGQMKTGLIDPDTGAETILDVAYGHVSNDGTRVAGLGPDDSVCVVDIGGGPCVDISRRNQSNDGSHGEGLQWAPNDEWIFVRTANGRRPVALATGAGASGLAADWVAVGAESWQRRAP